MEETTRLDVAQIESLDFCTQQGYISLFKRLTTIDSIGRTVIRLIIHELAKNTKLGQNKSRGRANSISTF
jgi:hypothetical protein